MPARTHVATALGFLLLVGSAAIAQQQSGVPEDISAAVVANNEIASGIGTVQIRINRWSTEADRTRLLTVLRESGPQALLKELQKMPPVGTIRSPNSVGYDLRYARQTPVGDGRRIVIATDRPISYPEATNQGRTLDYPFTLLQMQLDHNGKGTGTMSYATKIVANDDMIELEDIASAPFRLTNIEAKPRGK
jgi:hypothetical protein